MKLRLTVRLYKSLCSCMSAVAFLTLGTGAAWADAQNLTFSGASLTWDTDASNQAYTNEDNAPAAFSQGDNVSFTSESTVTLGENIFAGAVNIESGANVSIVPGAYDWDADSILLAGNLDAGSTLNIGNGTTLQTAAGASLESGLQLSSGGA